MAKLLRSYLEFRVCPERERIYPVFRRCKCGSAADKADGGY